MACELSWLLMLYHSPVPTEQPRFPDASVNGALVKRHEARDLLDGHTQEHLEAQRRRRYREVTRRPAAPTHVGPLTSPLSALLHAGSENFGFWLVPAPQLLSLSLCQ
jgi:hypothetical protein